MLVLYQSGDGVFPGRAIKGLETRQAGGKLLLNRVKKIILARSWIVEKNMW